MYRSFFPLESQAYVQISPPWIERDLETRLNQVDERLLFTPKLRELRDRSLFICGGGECSDKIYLIPTMRLCHILMIPLTVAVNFYIPSSILI